MSDTQISAFISAETKEQVERYAGTRGIKKGALMEQALLHHLQALRELPADIIIPPRLELTESSFNKVADMVLAPRRPTKAARDLMGRNPGRKRPG
jgi:hypothetical protein